LATRRTHAFDPWKLRQKLPALRPAVRARKPGAQNLKMHRGWLNKKRGPIEISALMYDITPKHQRKQRSFGFLTLSGFSPKITSRLSRLP
jgi:hypothetical protein